MGSKSVHWGFARSAAGIAAFQVEQWPGMAVAQNPALLLQQPTLPAWGDVGTIDTPTKLLFGGKRSFFSLSYRAGLVLLMLRDAVRS